MYSLRQVSAIKFQFFSSIFSGVIELPNTRISISQLKTAVRFNVIDDSVAIGFGKIVRLSLHVEDKYKALYSIIRKKQYMTIYIDDNEGK